MIDAFEDCERSVSICSRTITNLRFADDIDKASTTYGMEISAEKIKLMINNTRGISSDIKIVAKFRILFRVSNI